MNSDRMKICDACGKIVDSSCTKCPDCGEEKFLTLKSCGASDYIKAEKDRKKTMIIMLIVCGVLLILLFGYAAVRMVYFDPYSAYYKGNALSSVFLPIDTVFAFTH